MLMENADLLTEEEIASLPDEDEIAVAELLDEEEEDDDESPVPVRLQQPSSRSPV